MNQLHNLLGRLKIGSGQVLTEDLGDETIWAVKGCTIDDVTNFFKHPVDWVDNIPDIDVTLKKPFVVYFRLLPMHTTFLPTYTISGVDGTNVITIGVSGKIQLIPFTRQAIQNQIQRNRPTIAIDELNIRKRVHELILPLLQKLYTNLRDKPKKVDMVISKDDNQAYGHQELPFSPTDPDRPAYVAGYLTGCATDYNWMNVGICNPNADTYAVDDDTHEPKKNVYRFKTFQNRADSLSGVAFLYQGTDPDTAPVCEYAAGNLNGVNIDLNTSITKDY